LADFILSLFNFLKYRVQFISDNNLLEHLIMKSPIKDSKTMPAILTRTTVSNYNIRSNNNNEYKNSKSLNSYYNKPKNHIQYITIKQQYQKMR
jgi:hypothetical protein